MKKNLLPAILMLAACLAITFLQSLLHAQPTRMERFKKLAPQMVYPFMKGSFMSGVIPVSNLSEMPDTNREYKLIFDFTQASAPGTQTIEMNPGLDEVARILNLHMAAGIPRSKIKAVVVFHAGSIPILLQEAAHQSLLKVSNPNIAFLTELNTLGCRLVVCGQSLALREIPAGQLLPFIHIALAAKTTITKYYQEGYYVFEIKGE